jgi:hypothetical protein
VDLHIAAAGRSRRDREVIDQTEIDDVDGNLGVVDVLESLKYDVFGDRLTSACECSGRVECRTWTAPLRTLSWVVPRRRPCY